MRVHYALQAVWILLLGQLSAGCAFDFGYYFSRHASTATLQFGKQSDGTSLKSFKAIPNYDFSQQPFGSSTTRTLYLLNDGELEATNIQLSIDSPYYAVQSKCDSLPPLGKASCAIEISLNPLVFDSIPASLRVVYYDGHKNVTQRLPISAVSMRWAFLRFVPVSLSQPVALATAKSPRKFLLHVFYSGDLLLGKPDHDQIPPAKWSSLATAVSLATKSAALTVPIQAPLNVAGASAFRLSSKDKRPVTSCPDDKVTTSCDIELEFDPDFLTGGVTDPQAEADFLGQIGLRYYNGESANAFTGLTFQAHGFSTSVLREFDVQVINNAPIVAYSPTQPALIQVKVTNPNGTTVPGQNVSITLPKDPAFQQTAADRSASTCHNGVLIDPVKGCLIQLSFNPVVAALPATLSTPYSDSISISYNFAKNKTDSMPPLVAKLTGTAVQPAKLVLVNSNDSPISALSFDPIPAFHFAADRLLGVKNTGGVPAVNIQASPFSDSNFSMNPYCQASTLSRLPGSQKCQYSVNFRPTNANVQHNSSTTFTYENGSTFKSTPITLNVSGIGTTQALVKNHRGDGKNFYMGPYMFGQGARTSTLQLSIYGTNPVIGGLSQSGAGNGFSITSADCFATINAAAPSQTTARTCTLTIRYDVPATGTSVLQASSTVTFRYSDGLNGSTVNNSLVITFHAKSEPRPQVHFAVMNQTTGDQAGPYALNSSSSPTPYGDTKGQTLTLWNDSEDFPVQLNSLGLLSGAPEFSLNLSACGIGKLLQARGTGASAAVGSTCNYGVNFKPGTTNGPLNGSIGLAYRDEVTLTSISRSPQAVTAYATTEINPKPSLTNIDFGTVFVNSSSSITVGFRPVGYYSPTWWVGLGALPPQVVVSGNTCASNTGGGSVCSITFQYSPLTAAHSIPVGSTVSLTYNQTPGVTKSILFTFSGSAQSTSANLSFSGNNFGKVLTVLPNQSLAKTQKFQNIVVKNNSSGSGAADAVFSSLSITPSDGPFQYMPDSTDPHDCTFQQTIPKNGGECNLRVRFVPLTVGRMSPTLKINYQDLGKGIPASSSVSLIGIGIVGIHVFAGTLNTCIIDELQQAVCWGDNTHGQLGQGTFAPIMTSPQSMVKINFCSGVTVVQMAISSQHICAILNNTLAGNGVVSCWGGNANGRLGLGLSPSSTPDYASPLSPNQTLNLVRLGSDSTGSPGVVVAIVAGFEHTCVRLSDGSVKCWGGNVSSQLGNGNQLDVGGNPNDMGSNLKSVSLGGKAMSLAAGASHTCAVLINGISKCWGGNGYGQVGQGTLTNPIFVPGVVSTGASSVATDVKTSSGVATTCILFQDHTIKCFGETSTPDFHNPQPLLRDGNFYGPLGFCVTRTGNDYSQPAQLCWNAPQSIPPTDKYGVLQSDMGTGLFSLGFSLGVTQFVLGGTHGCSIFTDHNVSCWGSNSHGQLGNGTGRYVGENQGDLSSALKTSVIAVPGSTPIEIAAGALHSCVVLSDNTLKCWGEGKLDNANGHGQDTPWNATGGSTNVVYDGMKP